MRTTRLEARQRRKRGNYLAGAATMVAALALGSIVTGFVVLSNDLDAANQARDALARQVQGLGEKPVAGPPGSRGTSVAGPPGPAGSPGPPGVPGRAAPTLTPSPGPTGPAGPPGPSGIPGADSTAAGPPGPVGASGVPGAAGRDGAPGKDGQDGSPGPSGSDGTDGAPPARWTYTDPQGVTYTCVPADDFDADAPQYACTPDVEPSPQEPSPSAPPVTTEPSASSSGVLPLRLLSDRL